MSAFEQWLTDTLTAVAGVELLLPVIGLIVIVDSVLPFLPVETGIVTLLSIRSSVHKPVLPITAVIAASAWVGDLLAYQVGRTLSLLRSPSSPKLGRLQTAISGQLHSRTAVVVITARFVPVGRVIATMSAGACRVRFTRFLALSAVASALWAAWVTSIAVLSASWWNGRPALAAVTAVIAAVSIGALIDFTSRRRRRRKSKAKQQPVHSAIPQSQRP